MVTEGQEGRREACASPEKRQHVDLGFQGTAVILRPKTIDDVACDANQLRFVGAQGIRDAIKGPAMEVGKQGELGGVGNLIKRFDDGNHLPGIKEIPHNRVVQERREF